MPKNNKMIEKRTPIPPMIKLENLFSMKERKSVNKPDNNNSISIPKLLNVSILEDKFKKPKRIKGLRITPPRVSPIND